MNFTDTSNGDPTSWQWDFGDDSYSPEQNPTHTYMTAGSYTVSHAATNAAGTAWLNRTAYVNVTGQATVADFTATPTSGNAPLTVQFTDASSGEPTSWNWAFGDGAVSGEQNPSHVYASAGTYSINLTVSNAGGNNSIVKEGYVVVTSPVTCDASGPYVDFVIDLKSCPEENSGEWYGAVCVDNAMIRWARAGQSTPYFSTLSPWMWKRNTYCPNPGHSWAVDSPYNKPIYFVAVENSDTANVWYHHHAVAAEYLSAGDVRNSTWQDWKFFNYDDLNITTGLGEQIPNGTSISETTVTIKNITEVYGCGQRTDDPIISFSIDLNNNITSVPIRSYPMGYVISNIAKSQFIIQDIPYDLEMVLRSLNNDEQFTISKWEFDPTLNELTVYAYDISNSRVIGDIQGKEGGNYSIHMVHDMEFEKNRADVRQQLANLKKNPDNQISWIVMNENTLNNQPEKYVELWVYKSTPENKQLDNTVINGWKIFVYPVSQPFPGTKKLKK